jgi:hypothetical protein
MRWFLIFFCVATLVSGIVEMANATLNISPAWDKDGLWTGILLFVSGLIGLVGFRREYRKRPYFWE